MCIRRTLKEFKLECPTCRAPAQEEDLKPNHALEGCVGAYKAARGKLLAGARRAEAPTPAPAPAKHEIANGTTRRSKRKGANISAPPAPARDDAPPAKRTTRHASRNVEPKKRVPVTETRKATRSSARATTGAEASTSAGVVGGWGPPVRASRRSATPASPSEKDTPDEGVDIEDAGEAGDEDYGGTQKTHDEDDDVVSESDLEIDDTKREVVDLVRDDGGGGKSKPRPQSGRQPSAPSISPDGSDGKQRPGTVQCPICGIGVQEGLINSHVDVCLTRGGAFGSAIADAVGHGSSPKSAFAVDLTEDEMIAKLPKLVYHIMKDRPLKKLLADVGLGTNGRREQLIERHKEFTLRVNASIDSGHRPNLPAIAKEVKSLERDRDRAGMMLAGGLAGSGGSGAAAAAASKADVFGKLIADVKARGGKISKPQTELLPVEDSEDKDESREALKSLNGTDDDEKFDGWDRRRADDDFEGWSHEKIKAYLALRKEGIDLGDLGF